MKSLTCRDCGHTVRGAHDQEVLDLMSKHKQDAHPDKVKKMSANMSQDEMEDSLRADIKDAV